MAQTSPTDALFGAIANLPCELQTMIYDYSLLMKGTINESVLFSLANRDYNHLYMRKLVPSLLLARPKTFLQVFLRVNYVDLTALEMVHSFLKNAEAECGLPNTDGGLLCVRHLAVRVEGTFSEGAATAWMLPDTRRVLKRCAGVRSITIMHCDPVECGDGKVGNGDEYKLKSIKVLLQGPKLRRISVRAKAWRGLKNIIAADFCKSIKEVAEGFRSDVDVVLRRH